MNTLSNFINGAFAPSSGGAISVFNPATEEQIALVPDSTTSEAAQAVEAAVLAQKSWGKLPAIARAGHLRRIAQGIRERADQIARVISREQGKTMGLSTVEVHFTADYMDYMAEWARRIEGEILPSDRPNETIFLFRRPLGAVAGILPWNFPFFLIARKTAPALITGNTVVIKPSEETPMNADEFARIVSESDLPPGVFNLVHGRGPTVGHALASSPKIGMVSFTGSVETGSRIMSAAAANITKVNLELGGKAPAIVMADADLPLAVKAITASRVINSGQVCNCAERVYVNTKIADQFTEQLAVAMKATTYGDPLKDSTVGMGPLISQIALAKVDALVAGALQDGATAVTGAKRADRGGKGWYYEPTVLADCRQDMEITCKEVFGPVIPVVTFGDLDEAIAFANESDYGLTSSIYTSDLNVAMRACTELQFGETYINRENFEAMQGFHAGWRKSGIGGADGKHGVLEYTQTHMVYIQHT